MKKTFKRILSTLVAAAMILALFAGCGVEKKDPDPSAETTATTPTGTTVPTSDAVTTPSTDVCNTSDSCITSASSTEGTTAGSSAPTVEVNVDPDLIDLFEALGSFMDGLASAEIVLPCKELALPDSEGYRIDLAIDGLPGISVGVAGEALMLAVPEAYDKAVMITASEIEGIMNDQLGSSMDQFGLTEDQLNAMAEGLADSFMSLADIGEGFGSLFVSCLPEDLVEKADNGEEGISYTLVIDSDLVNSIISSLKAQVEADINVLSQASEGLYGLITGVSSLLTDLGVDPNEVFGDISSLTPNAIAGMLAQVFTGIAPVEIADPIVFEFWFQENYYSEDSNTFTMYLYDEDYSLFSVGLSTTYGDVYYFDLSAQTYDEVAGTTDTIVSFSSDSETVNAEISQYIYSDEGDYAVFSAYLFYGVYESYEDGEGEIVDFLVSIGMNGIDDIFCISGRCVYDEGDSLSVNVIGDIPDGYGSSALFAIMGQPVLEGMSLTVTPTGSGNPLGMDTVSLEEFASDPDVAAISDAFAQSELAQILGGLFAPVE